MGCADVVPGVSGGTMAFILGIYEELIESIRVLATPRVLGPLFRFDIAELLKVVRWKFLGCLLFGILTAVLSLAKVLEHALNGYPVYVWSFFFGLVLASVFTVSKRLEKWTTGVVVLLVVGTVAAYLIVGMVPLQTPEEAWFLFLSGALAICAMILPGISGSFILVVLGKYEYVLHAVNERDLVTLLIVACGCAVGLVAFAQILGWFLRHFHGWTLALLIGFMVGSLRKIWPWKETVRTILDRHGHEIPAEQINFLPDHLGAEVGIAFVLLLVGFGVVLMLDRIGHREATMDQIPLKG